MEIIIAPFFLVLIERISLSSSKWRKGSVSKSSSLRINCFIVPMYIFWLGLIKPVISLTFIFLSTPFLKSPAILYFASLL